MTFKKIGIIILILLVLFVSTFFIFKGIKSEMNKQYTKGYLMAIDDLANSNLRACNVCANTVKTILIGYAQDCDMSKFKNIEFKGGK